MPMSVFGVAAAVIAAALDQLGATFHLLKSLVCRSHLVEEKSRSLEDAHS